MVDEDGDRLDPGQRIDRYEIVRVEGSGGMGVVYRARDTVLDRDVALKRPAGELWQSPESLRRFAREARAAARLSHPHIVQVHEVLEHDGVPWLSLQFVPGKSLAARLAAGERPSIDRVIEWAEQLAAALRHAHERKVLHRDVKPANVLVTDDGRALLTDFGLARSLPRGEADSVERPAGSPGVTLDDRIAGTPSYMSPEQMLGRELDERSDLFSLGLVLYEICSGRPLFAPGTAQEAREALLVHSPPSVRAANRAVPRALDRVIGKLLAWRPEGRFADAGLLVAELRRCREERARRPRRVWLAAAGGAALLLALAVLGSLRFAGGPAGERRAPDVVRAMALVTWPGGEWEARVSPDGHFISFLSNHDGGQRLWLRDVTGGQVEPLTAGEAWVASHVWSAEGDEIAYLVRAPGGPRLEIVAPGGGPVRRAAALDDRLDGARLLRFLGDRLYLETAANELVGFDLARGTHATLIDGRAEGRHRAGFDVRPDGRRAAWAERGASGCAIWTGALDGGDAQAVTSGDHCDVDPLWVGAGEGLVYTSSRSGQLDLWRVEPAGGRPERITLSAGSEVATGSSADGSLVVFVQRSEIANLWMYVPAKRLHLQLSADALGDALPASVPTSSIIAFERTRPRLDESTGLFGAQILIGRLAGERMVESKQVAAEGEQALLAPDGQWVAYARGDELWVQDVATGHAVRVSTRYRRPAVGRFPLARSRENAVWLERGPALCFVEYAGGGTRVARYPAGGAAGEVRPVAETRDGVAIDDLWASPGGRRLAWIEREHGTSRLRLHDTDGGASRTLVDEDGPLWLDGWIDDRSLLVVRDLPAAGDVAPSIALSRVALDGSIASLGEVERAFVDTVRLVPAARRIYLTAAGDDRVDNLIAVSLDDGSRETLTDNTVTDVTFSTVAPAPDGALIYTRQQRVADLWGIEFRPQ
ncbi:MAG TPA: protein kinase [Candidatus Polarisedimenticolaceae bacterium]|nr:protein kinase [Candidatus Polarisedimenticolaceae bacterium]